MDEPRVGVGESGAKSDESSDGRDNGLPSTGNFSQFALAFIYYQPRANRLNY